MTLARRSLLTLPALAPGLARAQAWPTRPITLIVPFAAGGNVDTAARVVAPELSRRLGQSVVVENVPGAGGTIGVERVARAAPDGHTLIVAVESTMGIAPILTPQAVRYDAVRDFTPVAMLATLPLTLVGRNDLPAADFPALIELAKRGQGLTYATSGVGTAHHLLGEIIAQRTGAKLEHVPYRVSAQIPTDVMGGRLDLTILTITLTAPLVREGKIKPYAVSSPAPHPLLPGVPTLNSQPGLQGVNLEVWQGIFAPARTDPAIVARLAAETSAALAETEVQNRLASIGMTPSTLTRDALGAYLREEITRYTDIIRSANIRVD